jgi:hypothetical protein
MAYDFPTGGLGRPLSLIPPRTKRGLLSARTLPNNQNNIHEIIDNQSIYGKTK